jgi:hypothetical protein
MRLKNIFNSRKKSENTSPLFNLHFIDIFALKNHNRDALRDKPEEKKREN